MPTTPLERGAGTGSVIRVVERLTRIAVALGGNAMIRRGEPGSIEVQRHNLEIAARSLVDLA